MSTPPSPRASHRTAAAALTKPATPARLAPARARRARVPLVVVKTTVRPATRSAVYSAGELPHSKPGGGEPPRSPPRTTGPRGQPRARAIASAGVATGTTARAPQASAGTIVAEARTTSIIAALTPASDVWPSSSRVRATSIPPLTGPPGHQLHLRGRPWYRAGRSRAAGRAVPQGPYPQAEP